MEKRALKGKLDHDLVSKAKVVPLKEKTAIDVAKEKAAAKAAVTPKKPVKKK